MPLVIKFKSKPKLGLILDLRSSACFSYSLAGYNQEANYKNLSGEFDNVSRSIDDDDDPGGSNLI